MNFKRTLTLLLTLFLAISSLTMTASPTAVPATIHPAAMSPAPTTSPATTPAQPVTVTVKPADAGFGLLHAAVGTLAVATAVLGYTVYKNGRALRRMGAQLALTNNNIMLAHENTQQRFDQVDANVATVNNNIQESHRALTAQNEHTNANTAHMLQQINPEVTPLAQAPDATRAQFTTLGRNGINRAQLRSLPDQSALDRMLDILDSGLNGACNFVFSVPGVAVRVVTTTAGSMANPENSFLYNC